MNHAATLDLYGEVTEQATLTIRRLLPGSIDRVWAYLTQSDLRRQWLASGDMTLAEGATFTLVWRNEELAGGEAGAASDGCPEENRMDSRITAIDPPRLLAFEWAGTGGVVFTLEPVGKDTLLTVKHSRVENRDTLRSVSAGWHAHLDMLAALFAGTEPEPFWNSWKRLRDEYEARLPR